MAPASLDVACSLAASFLAPVSPLAAAEVPWTDIPGVRLIGAILGTLLLIAAIRSMFGRKG